MPFAMREVATPNQPTNVGVVNFGSVYATLTETSEVEWYVTLARIVEAGVFPSSVGDSWRLGPPRSESLRKEGERKGDNGK